MLHLVHLKVVIAARKVGRLVDDQLVKAGRVLYLDGVLLALPEWYASTPRAAAAAVWAARWRRSGRPAPGGSRSDPQLGWPRRPACGSFAGWEINSI